MSKSKTDRNKFSLFSDNELKTIKKSLFFNYSDDNSFSISQEIVNDLNKEIIDRQRIKDEKEHAKSWR